MFAQAFRHRHVVGDGFFRHWTGAEVTVIVVIWCSAGREKFAQRVWIQQERLLAFTATKNWCNGIHYSIILQIIPPLMIGKIEFDGRTAILVRTHILIVFFISLIVWCASQALAIEAILLLECILTDHFRHEFVIWSITIENLFVFVDIACRVNSQEWTSKTIPYVWIAWMIEHTDFWENCRENATTHCHQMQIINHNITVTIAEVTVRWWHQFNVGNCVTVWDLVWWQQKMTKN